MKSLIQLATCACLGYASLIWPPTDAAVQHQAVAQTAVQKHAHAASPRSEARHASIDRSGRVQVGKASVYSRKFAGRRMAGGATFHPGSDSAASRTLPLGTVASVINLETGRTARVRIRDRGPYKVNRILDVSPNIAGQLGMREDNVVEVAVTPIVEP